MGSVDGGYGALIVLRVNERVYMLGGSVGDGWGAVGRLGDAGRGEGGGWEERG